MDPAVYEMMARNELGHWWFRGRRRILTRLIEAYIAPPEGGRVLEAGCGTGGNMELLSGYGRLDAFEYDENARRRASDNTDIAVERGELPHDIPFEDGAYDLIALLDVLEHVDDDRGSLEALGEKLNSDGRLLITVPAFPALWSAHDEQHHHKRRYTKSGLKECIESAGLSLDLIGYFNTFLFPVAVAERAVAKMLGRQSNADETPNRLLNGLLYQTFAMERHLVGRLPLPFGLSLFAIAGRR